MKYSKLESHYIGGINLILAELYKSDSNSPKYKIVLSHRGFTNWTKTVTLPESSHHAAVTIYNLMTT